MTKEEVEIEKKKLNDEVDKYSDLLNSFPTNELGLVPDNIRDTQEWKDAIKNYNNAFSKLRKFNAWYVREYRKKKGK